MLQFNKIIKDEFADANLEEIILKISSHNLYTPIVKAIKLINGHLKNANNESDNYGTVQVSHIATCLLIKINEHFRALLQQRKQDEKIELEYMLGNIFKRLLILIVNQLPQNHKAKFTSTLYNSLKETCELYDYDFNILMIFLGIEKMALERVISSNDSTIINPTNTERNKIPCYIWQCGSDGEFFAFLKIIKKLKITENIKKVKQLFARPTKNLAIRMDEQQADFILQFFAYLKDVKFFSTNGYGFYQVLQCHVFNFDTVFLKSTTAQRRVDKVKKQKSWRFTKNMLEKEFMTIHKRPS